MRCTRPILVAVAVVASLSNATSAAVQRTSPWQWRGTVLQGSTLELRGVNGEIKAGPARGSEVEISAVRSGRRSNPEEVQIEVVQHGDGVTVCAVYPGTGGEANECRPGGGRMNVRDNDVKVTFTVSVPAGVRFAGHTVNGDIEATSLEGALSLSTVNGDVAFSTASYGDGRTVNGSIQAALGSATWNGELAFETVNGSITLDLPADTSADVRASTVNGRITTGFPVALSNRANRRTLNGTIGGGGRKLDVQTVNGNVKLQRR